MFFLRFQKLYKKGVLVPTDEYDENLDGVNKEAKFFYMSSLNGDVKKCPHGLDLAKYREDYNIDFSFEPLRCEKCHAKLLPNEFATDKMKTSSLCCAKGQIKCEGKPWQMSFVKDPPDLIKNLCFR